MNTFVNISLCAILIVLVVMISDKVFGEISHTLQGGYSVEY